MKKALFLLIPLFLIVLASCDNFMNGSNVQEQLTQMIDVANATSCTLIVSNDTTMGSFLSTGDKSCKLGYSIDVQYTVKKDLYIFKGLKAVDKNDNTKPLNDYVEFESIDSDDARGIYKVSIKLIKESNDILIVPECTLVPNVDAAACLPEYSVLGCEQDSRIKIVFNTAVTAKEFFSVSITDTAGDNLISYFGEPYFSADNQTLYIPTNKTNNILDRDGDIETKDIYVKIDLSYIQDKDGNTGKGTFQHKYRVNKNVDNVKPVLSAVSIFTTSDTQKKYYKTISNKTLSTTQDYIANHVNDSIYIEVEGSDTGSEGANVPLDLAGFIVKEKLINYTDGSQANETEFVSHINCSKDKETGKYCSNYTMKSTFDGLVKITIFAEDFAGNQNAETENYIVSLNTYLNDLKIMIKNIY